MLLLCCYFFLYHCIWLYENKKDIDMDLLTVTCQSKQYFCNLFNTFCNLLCEFEKITRSSTNVKLDIKVFSSLSRPQDSSNISCKSFTK